MKEREPLRPLEPLVPPSACGPTCGPACGTANGPAPADDGPC